jgi:hypothetical protein
VKVNTNSASVYMRANTTHDELLSGVKGELNGHHGMAARRCQVALEQGRKERMHHIQSRAGSDTAQPPGVHSSRLNPCFTMPKKALC